MRNEAEAESSKTSVRAWSYTVKVAYLLLFTAGNYLVGANMEWEK